jgi:putative ABC transport system ATP-binding protein
MRLLRNHCDDGGAGLLVTHDAAHAAWADRVVFLRDGRIVDESLPASRADLPEPVAVPV